MAREHLIRVISQTEQEGSELQSMLETLGHTIDTQVAEGNSIVDAEDAGVDLYVVSLPAGFSPPLQDAGTAGRVPRKRVLYITPNPASALRRELFRSGAAAVLIRPFKQLDLIFRADQILSSDWNRFRREFDEDAMLELLKRLLENQVEVVEPALEPVMPTGHFYPAVAAIMGRTALDRECLEKLASLGLLGREVANRVRLCPECDDNRLNFRESCPKCSSINILQQEMVTHFSCAYSAPLTDFRRGSELECPKCHQALRHIGVDYEKPSQLFGCLDCEYTFSDPSVAAQCLRCNCTSTPAQTIERTIYRFIVTPLAEQAVREGHITGVNLETLLRNTQTGLYSKSYFEHEIRRENVRSQRYSSPYGLLLVRIDNFDEIASMHPSEATQFAESIFKAVSSGLRTLDTTCVWDIDTLGVLLSSTPKQGANEVVRRIAENVKKLEYLYSVREPGVTIGLASTEDGHERADDMVTAAAEGLQE